MQLILSIQLFGGFHLTYDGTPLTLNAPNLQALLAYLLLHRDALQSRQQLAFILWPDSSDVQAQTNLRTLLHRLRQALPLADNFLQVDNRTLRWRSDVPLTLDVEKFESAIVRAQVTGTRAELEQAISWYRGDLLPSCYEDWIQPERERLRQQFLQALTQLIQRLEAQRDYNTALVHAQRLLQLDPLQETTYQMLMRLHAAHSDHVNIVRSFRQCETVLMQELGVEPGPETRELLARLQQAATVAVTVPPPTPATNNLPVPLNSFIGRTREMAELRQLLNTTRLLTLTGTGGSGKSRLALHIVRDVVGRDDLAGRLYEQGVWWVELAPLSDPTLIPSAVASVLGVPEQPGRALIETLADVLKAKHLLLVLDNCEHLVAACAQLANDLLTQCSNLQILATSREALGISGETIYAVPPLALPARVHEANWQVVAESDAPRLFMERAQAVLPTFSLTQQNATAVARVCERLDGIPLAIELASARVKVLSVEQIAARLDDRFNLLTTGDRTALPRHQKLRALVDWSYDLLDEEERALLRTLSVFAGGWTLDAAEFVYGSMGVWEKASSPPHAHTHILDLLSRLVDKSLVVVETERQAEGVRYRLLETIRQYAYEKLQASGEGVAVWARHLAFFLKLAEETEPKLTGPDQVTWLNRLESELDNLHAALSWAIASGDSAAALRLGGAPLRFWSARGYGSVAGQWLRQAIALSRETQTIEASSAYYRAAYGQALYRAAYFAMSQGYAEARVLTEESLAIMRELEDKAGIAQALEHLGMMAANQGDYVTARARFEESLALFRDVGDKVGVAHTLNFLGGVAERQGDYVAARTQSEESLALRRELGDKRGIANALNQLGNVAVKQGDYLTARSRYEESLSLMLELGYKQGIADVLNNLGSISYRQHDHANARALYQNSLKLSQELGGKRGIALCLAGCVAVTASAATVAGATKAARLAGATQALLEAINAKLASEDHGVYGSGIAATRAQLDEATFNTAWQEGQQMTLEQAIEYALKEE